MIEPLAAAVFNSFLPSRTTAGHVSSLESAVRAVPRPLRSKFQFPSQFFTPLPRSAEGNRTAKLTVSDECIEWSMFATDERCCAMIDSVWCAKWNLLLMMKEVIPMRHRAVRQRPPHPARSMQYSPSLLALANTHTLQRRHSSNSSDSAAPPTTFALARHKFLLHMNLPKEEFDANAAWESYETLAMHRPLKPADILSFVERLVTHIEQLYDNPDMLDSLHKWGQRLQPLLVDVSSRISSSSALEYRRRCLQLRAMALAGDIEQASSMVHQLQKHAVDDPEKVAVLVGYESLIMSIWRNHNAVRVMDFLLREWESLGGHLLIRSARAYAKEVKRQGRCIRARVIDILATIMEPAIVLAERQNWSPDRRIVMGQLFIQTLCRNNIPEDGLAVLEELDRQLLTIPISVKLQLVRALVRADAFAQANRLYWSLSNRVTRASSITNFKYYTSTGLCLFAHQGQVAKAQEMWDRLKHNGWISTADIAMLLQVNAVRGNAREVVRLFNEIFNEPSDDDSMVFSAADVHYTIVIFAHAQCCDYDGMNAWLEKMSEAGFSPDEYVYSIILKSFARRGDLESLASVLDQMRRAGMQPSAVQYTTAITLLAHRKDPVSAEAMYKRALREGVIPDRRMITALMNAHVEAASWKGVIRAFDYLKSSPNRHIRLTLEVYNTLLKAYVLIGAPFRIVWDHFIRLEEANIQPDAHTFALIIQSACDAGKMNVASQLFQQMERLATRWEWHLHINAYVLTIIMSGFLRRGDKIRAKAVYDEMHARGIRPTSITFGAILGAYGNANTVESIQIAEDFLNSLDTDESLWSQPTPGRGSPLEHIYGPLMEVYARRESVEDVERHFKGMLNAGGVPTLGVLTTLLYVYSRTGNTAALLEVWPQIFQLGLRHSRTDSLFKNKNKAQDRYQTKRQANILCLPLSIYINALSTAGMHPEIAQVWQELGMHGFTYDSHNWNHLAVALVRAGEPERAFEILEKVLLPYQKRSENIVLERDQQPETPLTFEAEAENEIDAEDEISPEPAFEGPSHSRQRRAVAVQVADQRFKIRALSLNQGREHDFAHHLHIMHQVSPSWSIWRPHNVTLSLLCRVLTSLQAGTPVEPVERGQVTRQFRPEENLEQQRAKADIAADILGRISTNYPHAVRVVREYRRGGSDEGMFSKKMRTSLQ